jgi:hypothetical protein
MIGWRLSVLSRGIFDNVDAQELSPIIDTAAARFNLELELEDDEKLDFKIKAKQFVKIYGQMAAIMPYELVVQTEIDELQAMPTPR